VSKKGPEPKLRRLVATPSGSLVPPTFESNIRMPPDFVQPVTPRREAPGA